MNYSKYQKDTKADITELIKKKGCQPILFVGSGLSKRYGGSPNWEELLTELGSGCPEVKQEYPYYRQSGKSNQEIGSIYADSYKEWAWSSGKGNFPKEYFTSKYGSDIFIKYIVAQQLKKIKPGEIGALDSKELDGEILALKEISPHAIITTNYDTLIEAVFNDYKPVIGQEVIRHSYMSIGEIFKIHGCISDPESIVLTSEDYDKFKTDKKYLSAKLLTFFVEHPLIFIGYSANDSNIKSILQEIDRILHVEAGLIENIYILEWNPNFDARDYPTREKLIDIGNGNSIRIKSVTANSFEWVFKAFKSEAPLEKVNIKLLRSITHRIFDLVRKDVAKNTVEINFEMLNHALNNPGELAKVYGIAAVNNPALLNLTHPFLPKHAAAQFGTNFGWQRLNRLIEKLTEVTGFDMRASDNKFHAYISPIRRYSQEGVDLLKKFKNGEDLPDLNDPSVTGINS
jgi:hypothetical protein